MQSFGSRATQPLSAPPCRLGLQPHRRAAARPSRVYRRLQPVAARRGGEDDAPSAVDRVVAAVPYCLPLLDGLRYAKFFFVEFPSARVALVPLQPLLSLYTLPFAPIVLFFALYLGVVQNQSYSRFVRFSAQQAILVDILLILPGLLESLIPQSPTGLGLALMVTTYNTIWLYVLCCTAGGVASCLLGKKILLPLVGEAADAQTM